MDEQRLDLAERLNNARWSIQHHIQTKAPDAETLLQLAYARDALNDAMKALLDVDNMEALETWQQEHTNQLLDIGYDDYLEYVKADALQEFSPEQQSYIVSHLESRWWTMFEGRRWSEHIVRDQLVEIGVCMLHEEEMAKHAESCKKNNMNYWRLSDDIWDRLTPYREVAYKIRCAEAEYD